MAVKGQAAPAPAPSDPAAGPSARDESDALRRLNRTLRALSNSSHALLHAVDEEAHLREVCRIVVEDCGHAMVWIGYAEDDSGKTVRPVTHAGFESGYLETLRVTWEDSERGRGPTGTAIRTGRPSSCRNMLTDPRFAPWREEAVRRGYASSLVLPLMAGGRAFGAITIYSRDPDPFLEDEQTLLEELANDLAFGITTLRERAAHRRAETAIRDGEARLATIIESLGEGLIVSSLDGQLLHWNRAALEMHGISGTEEVRRHVAGFSETYEFSTLDGISLRTDDWPLPRILRGELLRDLELRVRRPLDGWTRIYRYGGCVVRDAAGLPSLAVVTIADVTERHAAEEALRRAHERAAWLARFPQENPEPVLRLRSDLTVVYANDAARSALAPLGLRVDAPVPAPLAELAGRAKSAGKVREDVGCGDRIFSMSFCLVGTELNVYGQDVTDLRRAEGALRESERRYRDLAVSLQEADLRKNEFLGVLSHELRNPLAPIQSALHILDRSPPGSDKAQRAREVIRRQADHMARLVDDLLDVTRISHGKIQLRCGRVELGGLAGRVVEDHRSLYAAKAIGLDLRTEAGPIWIDADATRISQAIANLLQNAAKFTNAGGHVAVVVERRGEGAIVRVTDDGIGISPEVLRALFQPFRQADESLHRSAGGLGLGLALVKGLVELHGGTIEGRSGGIGRGAEFTISLPSVAGAGPSAQASQAAPSATEGQTRRRMLVIDDSPDCADTLKEVLELSGHEVAVAYDGREGVAMVRAHRPDVVFCDIGLPGIDGYEFARRIKADPALTPTLIALSGYALVEDRRKALQAGFDHHLGKPLRMEELNALLERIARSA